MIKVENKILLVDDEKDIVELMEEALQKERFHLIRKAYNGEEALYGAMLGNEGRLAARNLWSR